jgi:hypothetical protein
MQRSRGECSALRAASVSARVGRFPDDRFSSPVRPATPLRTWRMPIRA